MCLAIPMRVTEVRTASDNMLLPQIALVDADGIAKEVRLDLADRIPECGEYVIVHAGFAIHTLSEEDALTNLQLMREMGEAILQQDAEDKDLP